MSQFESDLQTLLLNAKLDHPYSKHGSKIQSERLSLCTTPTFGHYLSLRCTNSTNLSL